MSVSPDHVALNAASKLEYHDPARVLRNFRRVEEWVATSNTPDPIKHLRTNGLKRWRECRDAALFCYGMSQRTGQSIYFNIDESADYDFMATWVMGDTQYFAQVQLKELVPDELNGAVTINHLVQSLTKYGSSKLTIAIHLNRVEKFEPSKLCIPRLHVGALWFFWATSRGGSTWHLFGDVLGTPSLTHFSYPR